MIPEATINAVAQSPQPGWLVIAAQVYTLIQPFLWPVLLGLITWGITVLQKNGYRTTYIAAIARALGQGVMVAQQRGVDPFSAAGRAIVIANGAQYLNDMVGKEGAKLGINTLADHADRVSAEMGTVIAKATAEAQASAAIPLPAVLEATSGQGQLGILGAH